MLICTILLDFWLEITQFFNDAFKFHETGSTKYLLNYLNRIVNEKSYRNSFQARLKKRWRWRRDFATCQRQQYTVLARFLLVDLKKFVYARIVN